MLPKSQFVLAYVVSTTFVDFRGRADKNDSKTKEKLLRKKLNLSVEISTNISVEISSGFYNHQLRGFQFASDIYLEYDEQK